MSATVRVAPERRPPPAPAPAVGHAGSFVARTATVALTLTVLLETIRILLPLEWAKSCDIGVMVAAATFPVVFLTPLFAPGYRRLGRRGGVVAAVALLVGSRLALQATAPTSFALAVAATSVTLTAVVPILAAAAAYVDGVRVLVYGVVTGFVVDGVLRGAYGTWDHGFRAGLGPTLVTVGLLVALVAVAAAALRLGMALADEPARGRTPRAAALGLLLAPQMLFLQSPGYVGSSGRLSLAWSVTTVVAAGGLALLGGAVAVRRPSRVTGVVAGLLLTGMVYGFPFVTGPAVPCWW